MDRQNQPLDFDQLTKTVNDSWVELESTPCLIVAVSNFGNLLYRDTEGIIYRLIPEELSIELVAENEIDLSNTFTKEEFLEDWDMPDLYESVMKSSAPLKDNEVLYFKVPCVFGGRYVMENVGRISIYELLSVSGYYESQLKNLKDGQKVKLLVSPN